MPTPDAKPAVPAAPAAPVEQTFEDAFAEALADEPQPAAAADAGATAQDPPAGEPKPDAGAADAGAAAEGGVEGEAAAAAVEAAAVGAADTRAVPAVPAAPATSAGAETPEQELARLRAENAVYTRFAERGEKPAAAAAAAEPAAPAAPAAPAEPKWYQPAAEEVERVQAFEKEWPDIHQAVQVLVKQAGYNAAEYVFNTIAKVYNPQLQEFAQLSQTMQEQLALGALRSEHNDYDAIYDNVVAWVDTLSPAFKRGAKQVMESGTPEEVNDLISAYKETDAYKLQQAASGSANKAATPAPAAVNTTGLSAAAKKAAGKLQVVGSKRTTPVAPAAADDFEGAWAEALRSN